MLEILHFAILTQTPIILKGENNLGKKTAINFISNILNYKIIPIQINNKLKVEDLFGKINLSTKDKKIEENLNDFYQVLIDDEKAKKSILVFYNINNASVGIIEKLIEIFDNRNKFFSIFIKNFN